MYTFIHYTTDQVIEHRLHEDNCPQIEGALDFRSYSIACANDIIKATFGSVKGMTYMFTQDMQLLRVLTR